MLVTLTGMSCVNVVVSRMLTDDRELVIPTEMLVLVATKVDVVVSVPKLRLDMLVSVVQIVDEVVSVNV